MLVLLTRLAPIVLAFGLLEAGTDAAAPQARAQEEGAPNLEAQFEGALVGVEDFVDFAETPGYRRLLEMLAQYEPAELEKKAIGRLDFAQALSTPDRWRGRIMRLRGMVIGLETVRLWTPVGEAVDCYRAVITEPDGSEGAIVDFLEPPPPLELEEDVVDVEAVFFRVVRIESKSGLPRYAPYLIARGLRRLDQAATPRDTQLSTITLVLLGAAVAYLALRVGLSLRDHKGKKGKEEAQRARAAALIRERAARATSASPAAPSQEKHEQKHESC
jgi:hypothetical protein